MDCELDLLAGETHKSKKINCSKNIAQMWLAVGEELVNASRKSEVRMGILWRRNEKGQLEKVCGNDGVSAGFNILLREIDRLRRKLKRGSSKSKTTKRR